MAWEGLPRTNCICFSDTTAECRRPVITHNSLFTWKQPLSAYASGWHWSLNWSSQQMLIVKPKEFHPACILESKVMLLSTLIVWVCLPRKAQREKSQVRADEWVDQCQNIKRNMWLIKLLDSPWCIGFPFWVPWVSQMRGGGGGGGGGDFRARCSELLAISCRS